MVASTPRVGKRPAGTETTQARGMNSEIFRGFQEHFRTSRFLPEHSGYHRAGRVPAAESKESVA
jgi:hypothetical protein